MKRLVLHFVLLAAGAWSAMAAGAGTAAGSAAAGTGAPSGAVGPGEPDLLLPRVIMEVQDLSVEKPEAQLPPEEELLPARREIPLPAEGEITVGEASLPLPGVGTEAAAAAGPPRGIASEATLGAGMESSILGSLSVKTLGGDPRFGLRFSHESMDGFAANPPNPAGSGYGRRLDDLGGELSARLGPVEAGVKGSFREEENGLQYPLVALYRSTLSRNVAASTLFTLAPLDWLTLKAGVDGGLLSSILTGSTPLPAAEYRFSGTLGASARFEWLRLGVSAEYSAASAELTGVWRQDIQRARAGLSAGVDLPASFSLDCSAAFFWSTAAVSLLPFPFEIVLSGAPVDVVSFRAAFGYRVTPHGLGDLTAASPFFTPAPVADDRGWFAEAKVQLVPVRELTVSAAVAFTASEAMLDAAANPDGTLMVGPSGLFVLTQSAAARLSSELGIRWSAVPGLTLGAAWKHEYRGLFSLDSPAFLPVDELGLDGIGLSTDGLFGGNLSVTLKAGGAYTFQLPVVSLGGFFRVSDALRLQVDLEDLLQPALQGGRTGLYPFIEPGFRVTGKARLSF
jgi:hypothetical protein